METSFGQARVHVAGPPDAQATVVLLHGAGTDTSSPLLLHVAAALTTAGLRVVRIDQPYTLLSRRPPAPAHQLDAVVSEVVTSSVEGPFVFVGRSSGARVACRTARPLGAAGVIALAYPLIPPGGRNSRLRSAELAGAGVPVTVVQGDRDTFGTADDVLAHRLEHVVVVRIPGADHAFEVRRADARTRDQVWGHVAGGAVSAAWAQLAPT